MVSHAAEGRNISFVKVSAERLKTATKVGWKRSSGSS